MANFPSICWQMRSVPPRSKLDGILPCQASEDFLLDYGQHVLHSKGNLLCSAPTLNSTMDFSVKHVEDGVVNSPLDRMPRLPISCSPSPLRSRAVLDSTMSPTNSQRGTQRKFYGDENYPMSTLEAKSHMPHDVDEEIHGVASVQPVIPRRRSLSSSGCLKRKVGTSSCTQLSTPTSDAWERRLLDVQRREHMRQAGASVRSGCSRGPEILRAFEKMKSTS